MLGIISTERLLPRLNSPPQSVQLSILDSGCARFSPTGAIWLYDHHHQTPPKDLFQRLQYSFTDALTRFPHFAGQLCWASSRQNGHATHFGRAMVTFGSPEDPGVEWTAARLDRKASDLVPDASSRAHAKVWLGTGFPQKDLMASKTPLALGDLKTSEKLPAMVVQVTLLEDAYAIAIKIAHPLADASTLVLFAQHWAEASRAQQSHQQGPTLETPVFDPQLLDRRASGDVDASEPNEDIVRQADTLPLHRYDWWATDAEGYPPFMMSTTENSRPADPALQRKAIDASGEIPPWYTWDFSRPVTHAIIHFTPEQVDELRARVNQGAQRCSRLDAVLAHIWSAINRSRGLKESQEKVFLNMTMGVRARVDPPLPAGFAGSPLIIANVPSTGIEAAKKSSEETLALRIRECVDMFTPDAMGALLHKSLHEVSPQRFWQGFLGRHHILVTAWLRLKEQEISFFGDGDLPRYVHPIMPLVDGCLLVVDGHPERRGIDLSLYLESGAMERLVEDPELFL